MNENELAAGLAPTPNYRYADRVGDRLFLAGQVPLDSQGTLHGPDDIAAQTTQCLNNLQSVVNANGFSMTDVHHLTIHVVGERSALSEAWAAVTTFFNGNVPPATLLGTTVLGYTDQLVEIDAHVERG